ncbi:MAG: Mut7-C RNAse domain-containing protein [Cyanobacteriota bacterium]|nr:Mut7-C RNAse domain-containing protein [Cyanobacteriota bacterium]
MALANFRFYGELNFFLPPERKEVEFVHNFKKRPSIKDTIEALGIPHPEVYCIEVNGENVDFSYILTEGDRVDVYPVSAGSDREPTVVVRPPEPTEKCFVLDVHLGKLASSLRMLGFDTLYRNDYDDEELAEISAAENRILLTRDTGLLMRGIVTYGYYVRSTHHQEQLKEVMERFELFSDVEPFKRCIRCNGLLEAVTKEAILDRLPEQTKQSINEFHQCQSCAQIYWRGSHYERMQKFIDGVMGNRISS